MNRYENWSGKLLLLGAIALVAGAVDPMEGSFLVLPGSVLYALGTYLRADNRRRITFRIVAMLLIVAGVASLWGLSALGGVGGTSGRSLWWGLAILPYPVGWSMSIWGPGSPRWMRWLGIVLGCWYLALATLAKQDFVIVAVGLIGLLTLAGCAYTLIRDRMRLVQD